MKDLDPARALRRLRRSLDMLQTDLQYGRMNEELLVQIETHMKHGIGTEPRCIDLVAPVDAFRGSTLTQHPE